MTTDKAVEDLCREIENSDLSEKVKSEAIALLKRNLTYKHRVKDYNKGVRPDSLN